jgi:PAS domain-containing protein
MPKRSLGSHVAIWEQLVAAVTNNIDELIPVVRGDLEILKQAVAEIRELKKRQTELRAAAQQATRDLEVVMETANRATVRVNQAILATYGSKAEKLTEYGLRPWRPRRRKAVPEDPPAGGSAAPSKKNTRKPRRRPGS